MSKVLDKTKAILTGWSGLPAAVEKGDESAVRRILADHDVDTRMAAILLMIPAEIERLEKVIEENSNLEDAQTLSFEMGALSRYTPKTPEEAAATATARVNCQKRRDKTWFGEMEKHRAESELAGLRYIFSEVFDGTPGKKACNIGLPAAIRNTMVLADLDVEMLLRGPWTEVFGRAPMQPKKRLRLLAR